MTFFRALVLVLFLILLVANPPMFWLMLALFTPNWVADGVKRHA